MKYRKNQYTEGVTLCGAIITGALIYWGITSFIPYDPVNSWWGLFPLIIGLLFLTGGIVALTNRGKLKRVVLYEFASNPDITIEEVAQNTGITNKDLKAIVLDLKASGELRGKFSSATGQIKNVYVQTESQGSAPDVGASEGKTRYCPNCGTSISKESAMYCSYCGTQLT
ncbi:MAG: zinc ribbon domain-containing protein [Promethearchaeota archaeon]